MNIRKIIVLLYRNGQRGILEKINVVTKRDRMCRVRLVGYFTSEKVYFFVFVFNMYPPMYGTNEYMDIIYSHEMWTAIIL